jgi:BirA family transcriptional regulator, biotin operon repressor / biotin---[acetyl-CoA-carboxylase] ligase
LALNFSALKDAPIIELDTIDSSNNYAMQLIDADTAQPGLTIVTQQQTQGKGQRGRQWADILGQSLLMSIITAPQIALDKQFIFSAAVAVAVAETIQSLDEMLDVRVKWPNDIIINDKKTGGILIENVLRGSNWTYSIVGLGVNILQANFPAELPNAGSLKIASGKEYNISQLMHKIRENILQQTSGILNDIEVMEQYNTLLYRIHSEQTFTNANGEEWKGIVVQATADGRLEVQLNDGEIVRYTHGSVTWKWPVEI